MGSELARYGKAKAHSNVSKGIYTFGDAAVQLCLDFAFT